jgi:hypothetical protein
MLDLAVQTSVVLIDQHKWKVLSKKKKNTQVKNLSLFYFHMLLITYIYIGFQTFEQTF